MLLWATVLATLGVLTCWASDSPPVIHRAALNSTDQQPEDGFGAAVAVDGNTAVVGATFVNAAYVFVRPSNGWHNMTQTAKLTASDNADHFGASVAISGDTIVVGAPYTTVDGQTEEGAAYIFVRPASGWTNMTQTAKLTGLHLDGKGTDLLGNTVSIFGGTIVVGVPNVYQEGSSLGWGEALVYVRPLTGWADATETAVLYINPIEYPLLGVGFGVSAAVGGDAIVVGADGCCVAGETTAGQAFVYVAPAQGWTTTSEYDAELTGTEVQSGDFYGESVAIDGKTVVVGSPQTDTFSVGAAYIYVEPDTGWESMTQTAELYPLFSVIGNFGESVAISGRNVLIGAPLTIVQHLDQGAAYIFTKPKDGWRSTMKFSAKLTNAPSFYAFGQSVAIAGPTAVVGFNGTFETNGGAEIFWIAP